MEWTLQAVQYKQKCCREINIFVSFADFNFISPEWPWSYEASLDFSTWESWPTLIIYIFMRYWWAVERHNLSPQLLSTEINKQHTCLSWEILKNNTHIIRCRECVQGIKWNAASFIFPSIKYDYYFGNVCSSQVRDTFMKQYIHIYVVLFNETVSFSNIKLM